MENKTLKKDLHVLAHMILHLPFLKFNCLASFEKSFYLLLFLGDFFILIFALIYFDLVFDFAKKTNLKIY